MWNHRKEHTHSKSYINYTLGLTSLGKTSFYIIDSIFVHQSMCCLLYRFPPRLNDCNTSLASSALVSISLRAATCLKQLDKLVFSHFAGRGSERCPLRLLWQAPGIDQKKPNPSTYFFKKKRKRCCVLAERFDRKTSRAFPPLAEPYCQHKPFKQAGPAPGTYACCGRLCHAPKGCSC